MAEAKMKIKRIIRNLTYVIVVGAVLFIGVEIEMFLKQKIFRDLNRLDLFYGISVCRCLL